jgi:hypothetical protein
MQHVVVVVVAVVIIALLLLKEIGSFSPEGLHRITESLDTFYYSNGLVLT